MASQTEEHVYSAANVATETTSLLNGYQPRTAERRGQYWRRVVILNIVMLFFLELGVCLLVPGLIVALEERLCHDVDTGLEALVRDCKTPAVQGKLAVLRGWQATVEAIPGQSAPSYYYIHDFREVKATAGT